jgi:hypothetical protein
MIKNCFNKFVNESGGIDAIGYYREGSQGQTIRVFSNSAYAKIFYSENNPIKDRQDVVNSVYGDWKARIGQLGEADYSWVNLRETNFAAIRMAAAVKDLDTYILTLNCIPNNLKLPNLADYSRGNQVSVAQLAEMTGAKFPYMDKLKSLEYQSSGPQFGGIVISPDGKSFDVLCNLS